LHCAHRHAPSPSMAVAPMTTSPPVEKPPAAPEKKAFLIWDEGFALRFFVCLLAIIASVAGAAQVQEVQLLVWEAYQEMLFRLMDGASRMAWWSVIGLLSSSCCALQLLLNAVNFGCAGFNTTLGPLRPFFCALTVCIQGAVWYTAYDKPFQRLYVGACTALVVSLTLLPEMTAIWVQRGVARCGAGEEAGPIRSHAVLALDGMNCAACTKKVAEVLDAFDEVVGREISLERKEVVAFLTVPMSEAGAAVGPKLVKGLSVAGFSATVSSVTDVAKGAQAVPDTAAGGSEGICCGGLPISIGAGLLSSSCCLLQLGLNLLASFNVLHVGCAGFNKVLGPWRWHLRLLTAAWLSASWLATALRRRPRRAVVRLLCSTAVCMVLMFLPEGLLMLGGPAVAPPTEGAQVLEVSVEGMGCEACQTHVQGLMDRASGVVGSRVDFKAGRAELVVNRDWAFDFQALAQRLEEDGYTATLRSEL